jgi:hypothetical protein
MTISAVDVLVAIPVIPLIPVLATWYLPWEDWIPRAKFPKAFLGSYLLYAAFAASYFKFHWLVVATAAGWGAVVFIQAVLDRDKKKADSDTRQVPRSEDKQSEQEL